MEQVVVAHLGAYPSREFSRVPSLWVKGDMPATVDDEGVLGLRAGGTYDFTTFFGALSLMKLRQYTVARDFSLTLEVRGEAQVVLTYASTFDFQPRVLDATRVDASQGRQLPDGWREVSVAVPELDVAPAAVLVGFMVEAGTDVGLRNVAWRAAVEEGRVRPVELALCTTTFKKESYIKANAASIDRYMKLHPEMARHFTMHVVDNGRTLSAEDVASPVVRLHPNPNAGGAGGFARGMIEAMEQQPRATHVLLMDDDVSICPESLFRTYALLTIVAPAWEDAFIGGAMMDYEDPALRFEDIGFMNKFGTCARLKPPMRMDLLHDVVENEAFEPPIDNPACQDQHQRYQAWFYCCIPVAEIERRGMPLPLFVRFDDVEFSLRAGDDQKIMSLNGVCVWHLPFFMRADQVTAFYQVPRNLLMARACTGIAPLSDFEGLIRDMFDRAIWQFNYQGSELIIEALHDYLEGPEVTLAPGFAERRFLETHRAWNKYRPLEEMRDELVALGVDPVALKADKVVDDLPRTEAEVKLDEKTANGQRRSLKPYTVKGKVAVIDAADGSFQPGVSRRADVLVAIDVPNGTCEIRRRDSKCYARLCKEFDKCMSAVAERRDELQEAYRTGSEKIRTVNGWREYLGLTQNG